MTQNARGLFRATGKASRAVADLVDGELVKTTDPARNALDFYPTPTEPPLALLRAEHFRLCELGGKIWEPAAGDGAMARIISACGFPVVTSDIVDRGHGGETRSFFDYDTPPAGVTGQITNPPYDLINSRDGKGRWLTHSLNVLGLEYVALLLSWAWPGAAGLGPIYDVLPPARVYLMRWKIDWTGGGAPPMLNAWFVWDRQWKGETVLRMLDRTSDARQKEMSI